MEIGEMTAHPSPLLQATELIGHLVVTLDGGEAVSDASGEAHSEFSNAERNSVGHDVDGDLDTLETDGGRAHPGALTENVLRRELGIPLRESYGDSPGDGRRVEFRETEV